MYFFNTSFSRPIGYAIQWSKYELKSEILDSHVISCDKSYVLNSTYMMMLLEFTGKTCFLASDTNDILLNKYSWMSKHWLDFDV